MRRTLTRGWKRLLASDAPVGGEDRTAAAACEHTSVQMEVVTQSGRADSLSFHIDENIVEVWRRHRRCAVFDRRTLRSWLACPEQELASGEVVLSLDRVVDSGGRVAITLPDVWLWTLAPACFDQLRKRV